MNTISSAIGNYENISNYDHQSNAGQRVAKKTGVAQTRLNQNRTTTTPSAQVNLSDTAKMVGIAHQEATNAPYTRQDKIMALKSSIRNGLYQIDPGKIAEKLLQGAF